MYFINIKDFRGSLELKKMITIKRSTREVIYKIMIVAGIMAIIMLIWSELK